MIDTSLQLYPDRIPAVDDDFLSQVPTLETDEIEEYRAYDAALTFGTNYDPKKPQEAYVNYNGKLIPTIQNLYLSEHCKVISYEFVPAYLETEEGQKKLNELIQKLDQDTKQTSNTSSFEDLLIKLGNVKELQKDFDDICKRSELYVDKYLANELLQVVKINDQEAIFVIAEEDIESIEPVFTNKFSKVKVIANPEVVEIKRENLRKLKSFYKQEIRKLKTSELNLDKAKVILIQMHIERVNQMLADLYEFKSASDRKLNRIDKFRHGVSNEKIESTGDFSPLLQEIEKIIEKSDSQKQRAGEQSYRYITLTQPVLNWQVSWSKARQIIETTLQRLNSNIISKIPHTFYNPLRSGDARLQEYNSEELKSMEVTQADLAQSPFGWQIVCVPTSTMAVDSKQLVLKMPNTTDPKKNFFLRDKIAVLLHEIKHLFQNTNTKQLGLSITEYVGLSRSGINAEAGAIDTEAEIKKLIKGEERFTNTFYYRAMRARLKGQSLVGVSVATANDMLKSNIKPEDIKENWHTNEKLKSQIRTILEQAVNRSRRLFRYAENYNGGVFTNSATLHYIEQNIYVDQLPEEDRSVLNYSKMNIKHYKILQKMGLIPDEQKLLKVDEHLLKIFLTVAQEVWLSQQE